MVGIIDNWHEKLKPNETPPKLEEIYKDREKQGDDQPLTAEGEARYRGFWDSWRGPRCPERICVFPCQTLRDFSRSQRVQRKRACVQCCVVC